MGEIMDCDLALLGELGFKDAFCRFLFDRDEVSDAIYRASEVASVFDWTFDGICSYFAKPSPGCWPVTANLKALTKSHKKPIRSECFNDAWLMELLESGKAPRKAEEELATKLIFQRYLCLISGLQSGELIAKGRESALGTAIEVPTSLWFSEFSFVSLRRNELLHVDGEVWKVVAEDLRVHSADSFVTEEKDCKVSPGGRPQKYPWQEAFDRLVVCLGNEGHSEKGSELSDRFLDCMSDAGVTNLPNKSQVSEWLRNNYPRLWAASKQ